MKIDNIDNESSKKGFAAMSRKQMRKAENSSDKTSVKKSDHDNRMDRANKSQSMSAHHIEYDPYDDPHDEMFD